MLKFTGKQMHQGDCQIFEIVQLPCNVEKVEKTFFAKSEKSGHLHGLFGDYEMYEVIDEDKSMRATAKFIKVGKGGATLNHTKYENFKAELWDKNVVLPVADHKPTILNEGIYVVGIQRRKKQFSKLFERVKD